MNRFIRIAALLLCLVMMISVFASCSDEGSDEDGDGADMSSDNKTAEDATPDIASAEKVKTAIKTFYTGNEETVIFADGKLVDGEKFPGKINFESISYDGSAMACAVANNEGLGYDIYVFKDNKVIKIDEKSDYFYLSENGEAIVYNKYNNSDGNDPKAELYLCRIGSAPQCIYSCTENIEDFTISPDGNCVAFNTYKYEDGKHVYGLLVYSGGEIVQLSSDNVTVRAVENGGNRIWGDGYNEGKHNVVTYDKNGEKTRVADGYILGLMFNRDHTEALCECNGRTYISADGKEGKELFAHIERFIGIEDVCRYTGRFSTLGVSSFYLLVLLSGSPNGHSVYMPRKDGKITTFVRDADNVILTEDGEYIYYSKGGKVKMLKVADGENADEKAVTLIDADVSFWLADNASVLYYVKDGTLMSVDAKTGKDAKIIANINTDYGVVTVGNTAYYYVDGDLCACDDGSKNVKILKDAYNLSYDAKGNVFAWSDNTLYVVNGTSKPSKTKVKYH